MAENSRVIASGEEGRRDRYTPMSSSGTAKTADSVPPAPVAPDGADCLGEYRLRHASIFSTHLEHALNTSSRVARSTRTGGQTLRPALT